jgi:hypothetical protein
MDTDMCTDMDMDMDIAMDMDCKIYSWEPPFTPPDPANFFF